MGEVVNQDEIKNELTVDVGKELTIKEYADQTNRTPNAVYNQLNRPTAQKELKGHIKIKKIDGRKTKVLDYYAIQYLEKSREDHTTGFSEDANTNKDIKIAELEKQVEELQKAKEDLANEYVNKLMELSQGFNKSISDLTEQNKLLTENNRLLTDNVEKITATLEEEQNKTFWQRLRGK